MDFTFQDLQTAQPPSDVRGASIHQLNVALCRVATDCPASNVVLHFGGCGESRGQGESVAERVFTI